MKESVFAIDLCEGVTVVTVHEGLFDKLFKPDEFPGLAAEVMTEFRAAVAGAGSVVVDLRRAGQINVRALSVCASFAHALKGTGARRAFCGSANLKQIWDLCSMGKVAPCFEELAAAITAVGTGSGLAEPGAAPAPASSSDSERTWLIQPPL